MNALFAMTLSVGLQADYASLIDKHQRESLRMIREADKSAQQLLVVAPDTADAELHHREPVGAQAVLPPLRRNPRR